MAIELTDDLIFELSQHGITTFLKAGAILPDDVQFEPPCSLKWMSVQHSLKLGAFSYAVSGFYFACEIGRYCSFGEDIQIGRHSHPMHWASSSPFFYTPYRNVLDQDPPDGIELTPPKAFRRSGPPVQLKKTTICHDVWIGHGAFVLPGVTIGTGAVIAARSVVTKDVPPYAIVAGSPAKIVRKRFTDGEIDALLDSAWWEFAPWDLQGAVVDDVGMFVEHVKKVRGCSTAIYQPNLIELGSLLW